MVAEATYTRIDPAQLAVFSPVIMQLLRNGLGFDGVIVSDDLGEAAAVASIPAGQRALDYLTAGGDLITSQAIAPAEQMAAAVLATASSRLRLPRHRRRRRAPGARGQAGPGPAALLTAPPRPRHRPPHRRVRRAFTRHRCSLGCLCAQSGRGT